MLPTHVHPRPSPPRPASSRPNPDTSGDKEHALPLLLEGRSVPLVRRAACRTTGHRPAPPSSQDHQQRLTRRRPGTVDYPPFTRLRSTGREAGPQLERSGFADERPPRPFHQKLRRQHIVLAAIGPPPGLVRVRHREPFHARTPQSPPRRAVTHSSALAGRSRAHSTPVGSGDALAIGQQPGRAARRRCGPPSVRYLPPPKRPRTRTDPHAA
jgi:hypothetical protein